MTTATKTTATVPAGKTGNIKILREFFGVDGMFTQVGDTLVPAPKMSLTAFRDDIRATDTGVAEDGSLCLTIAERNALVAGIEDGSFTY